MDNIEVYNFKEISVLNRAEKRIFDCLDNIKSNYLEIGRNLALIKENKLYVFDDYSDSTEDFYEYAFNRFNLKSTSIKNLINIYDRFCVHDDSYSVTLLPEYKGFGYSQLSEMLPMEDTRNFTPDTTVKEIRKVKALEKVISKACEEFDLKFDNFKENFFIDDKQSYFEKNDYFDFCKNNSINLNSIFKSTFALMLIWFEKTFKKEDDDKIFDFNDFVVYNFLNGNIYNLDKPISYKIRLSYFKGYEFTLEGYIDQESNFITVLNVYYCYRDVFHLEVTNDNITGILTSLNEIHERISNKEENDKLKQEALLKETELETVQFYSEDLLHPMSEITPDKVSSNLYDILCFINHKNMKDKKIISKFFKVIRYDTASFTISDYEFKFILGYYSTCINIYHLGEEVGSFDLIDIVRFWLFLLKDYGDMFNITFKDTLDNFKKTLEESLEDPEEDLSQFDSDDNIENI